MILSLKKKNRFVKEQSKIPITVSWDGGVERFSGLLDVALAGGFVVKPSNGWYQRVDLETGELIDPKQREADTLKAPFWIDLLASKKFQDFVTSMYCIGEMGEVSPESFLEGELE